MVSITESISKLSLHKRKDWKYQHDIYPFIIVYSIYGIYLFLLDEWSYLSIFVGVLIVFFNVLINLICHWSIETMVSFRYDLIDIKNINNATHILCIPPLHSGKSALVRLNRENNKLSFEYQRLPYNYNPFNSNNIIDNFTSIECPDNLLLSSYMQSSGLSSNDIITAQKNYKKNEFSIPPADFMEFLIEHLTAPFFLFQLLCVLLWCLDEYWYYSIMTLVMLIIFETTVVNRRIKNVDDVRSMRMLPYDINIYRDGKWGLMKSDEIVPGDIISLVRPTGEQNVPCDVLLLKGECVVNESLLTGESVPQIKDCLYSNFADENIENLSMHDKHKNMVIFGGTQIVIASSNTSGAITEGKKIKNPPDNGCIGYALRTGFHTTQGKLVRTILFSTDRVSVNNVEALIFIGILLIFAIAASAYVLMKGLENEKRSHYKLVLHCVMIITSVVPPELPMELSLAVNNSLIALIKLGIFCTEPFRIPFAGAIDVCCFDKTGTLTSDHFQLEGIAGLSDEEKVLMNVSNAPELTAFVLGACNSLVSVDNSLVGDPVELTVLKAIDWNVSKDIFINKDASAKLRLIHRYPFSSELKRMCCIVQLEHKRPAENIYMSLCKGAPEEIMTRLSNVPLNYQKSYQYYSFKGFRVLALAYKYVEIENPAESKSWHRNTFETDLIFAGFLVLSSPLKPGSKEVVTQLIESSHKVIMITGDHALTACQVAYDLGMAKKSPLICTINSDVTESVNKKPLSEVLKWVSSDEKSVVEFSPITDFSKLSKSNPLCLTGSILNILQEFRSEITEKQFCNLIINTSVFARTSPTQKELILTTLKSRGLITSMVGDGTNDVGALKQAHIGVALISNPPKTTLKKTPAPPPNETRQQKQLRKMIEESQEAEVVRLGDASIAAPFSSKTSNITCVLHILKQGRCTLVTTIQMFQILALNCLLSAYSLSVLTLDGVKLGDIQATIGGLGIALFFLFISSSKPVDKLSAERPYSSVFSPYVILSIVGQFSIHLYTLMGAVALARPFAPINDEMSDPDGKFHPNLVNTVVFLVSQMMTVATFAINYRGRPFMESLRENKNLFRSLIAIGALVFCCVMNVIPELNESLELVPFPTDEFRSTISSMLIVDFAGAWLYEYILRFIFVRKSPLSN